MEQLVEKTAEKTMKQTEQNVGAAEKARCDDDVMECKEKLGLFDRLLPKPIALRKQDLSASSAVPADETLNKASPTKTKKSGSLRAVSSNFIKAILSTRDKAHSCPPGPINGEHLTSSPLR